MIQRLKESVEQKFGKKMMYQRDCTSLSASILEETFQLLSPSTLRRFFGFLATNSNPSRVTLDILSSYCGFLNWDDFRLQNGNQGQYADSILTIWEMASRKAADISEKNFNQLEQDGISQQYVDIKRSFSEKLAERFLNSTYGALSIRSFGGTAKTALMLHWYKQWKNSKKHKNDIIILMPATFLENWVDKYLFLENWLLTLLDIPKSALFDRIREKTETIPGRFILLIDGLDRIASQRAVAIYKAIDQLLVNLPANEFKVIISTRPLAWNDFVKNSTSISSFYCVANHISYGNDSTIPCLNNKEIQAVLDKEINHKGKVRILVEQFSRALRNELQKPYSLTLFIENFKENNEKPMALREDLLIEKVKNLIFLDQFPDEKMDIINAIISTSHKEKQNGEIKLNDLKALYPIHLKLSGHYFSAYNQLLSYGILVEELHENEFGLMTKITKFSESSLGKFLLVQQLINENNGITFDLFTSLEKHYSNSPILPHLLLILYALSYKLKHSHVLMDFFTLSEETIESVCTTNDLLQILCSDPHMRNALVPHYAKIPLARKYLFEQYNDLSLIPTSASILPHAYLEHATSKSEELYANSLIALSKAYNLKFDSVDETYFSMEQGIPDMPYGPFAYGAWFSHLLISSYINGRNNFDAIFSLADSYVEKNLTNNLIDRKNFELTLMYAMLFARQYNMGLKRITPLIDKHLNNPQTPEDKALAIYTHYLHWKTSYKVVPNIIQKIDEYLKDIPQWIELQIQVVAKSFLSMLQLTEGQMHKSFEYFKIAIEFCNLSGNIIQELRLLKEMGLWLPNIGEQDSAESCQQLAISLAKEKNFEFTLI